MAMFFGVIDCNATSCATLPLSDRVTAERLGSGAALHLSVMKFHNNHETDEVVHLSCPITGTSTTATASALPSILRPPWAGATWHQSRPSALLPRARMTDSGTGTSTSCSTSSGSRSTAWALRSPARQAWTCRGSARRPPAAQPSAAQVHRAAERPARSHPSAPLCAAAPAPAAQTR